MSVRPILFSTPMVRAILSGRKTQTRRVAKSQFDEYAVRTVDLTACAPIRKDDILYVRESYCPRYFDDYSPAYKADYDKTKIGDVVPEPKWKPSIHMPQDAARIFLRVSDVRVERLQEISEADAIAEGITLSEAFDAGNERFVPAYNNPDNSMPIADYVGAYQGLWNSLNAKRGYGWDKNPWVWVYEFGRCEKPT